MHTHTSTFSECQSALHRVSIEHDEVYEPAPTAIRLESNLYRLIVIFAVQIEGCSTSICCFLWSAGINIKLCAGLPKPRCGYVFRYLVYVS